jgi:hypothetical protein
MRARMLPYAPMRPSPRGPVLRRIGSAAAVSAAGLLAAIVFTYPLTPQLARAGRLNSDDGKFSVWNVAWVARALVVDPAHLYDANNFYPHRGTLAYSESNIGAGVLAMPVYWTTRSALAAHNSAVLASFALAAIGMFLLARHLTADTAASIVAALLFAYCPYVFSKFAHIQLLMTAGLPLALLAFHRLADRPSIGRSVVLAAALVAQGLACAYYGIFAAMMMGYAFVFYAIARGLWRDWRYLASVVGAGLLAVIVILPFFRPYLQVQEAGSFSRSLDEARTYAADWRSYFTSNAVPHRWIESFVAEGTEVLFPGFVAVVAGALGAWMTRRNEAGRFYTILGILALWASFGPAAGLYTVFFRTIPVFSLLRAPARFGIIVVLALAVLAALAIAKLATGRRWIAWTVAAVAAIDLLQIPIVFRQLEPFSPVYRVLATLPRGAVAEFPFYADRSNFPRHAQYLLSSTVHWQPMINGYSDYIPDDFRDAAPTLDSFPSPGAFNALQRFRARYVVMHFNLMDHRSVPRIKADLEGPYAPYVRLLARDGENVWLYQIVGWPRS